MPIDHSHFIKAVDTARKKGQSYDDVVSHFERNGFKREEIEPVLQQYAETTLPDGRKRGQTNLGDPDER